MSYVFILWYIVAPDTENEDELLIGVYKTDGDAKSAIELLKDQSGFKDAPPGFQIVSYELILDHWNQGYVRPFVYFLFASSFIPSAQVRRNPTGYCSSVSLLAPCVLRDTVSAFRSLDKSFINRESLVARRLLSLASRITGGEPDGQAHSRFGIHFFLHVCCMDDTWHHNLFSHLLFSLR